ncbi:ATP-dependent nuclease [Paramicrobacterium sp. CJ85]|uniref:ATP-dependent nuclease n=1 Tax=Paramicrobacterium sp. CJ85 TaxID=3445355 RepID=UPI003F617657
MKLIEVTVQNYRSIAAQTKFTVEDLTTLVGPNNEGKSNLLRALALGMDIIRRWSVAPPNTVKGGEVSGPSAMSFLRSKRVRGGGQLVSGYRWSDDYPLAKQGSKGTRPTLLRLKFKLDDEEVRAFNEETGIASNGELPVEITLGRLSVTFGVVKPGRGAATHRAKSQEIAEFIAARISLVSVPAVRTSDQALALVNELVRIRTRSLLNSDEYQKLTARLNQLRSEAVGAVGNDLANSVKRYIPSIQTIELHDTDFERSNSIEDLSLHDGTATSIESKGDGIKSLVTMALIHELAQERSQGHSFVLAVDEPEAHLHPASVHELQILFQELAIKQQVILATHNPVFVNRERVSSNILVMENSARPARNVAVIREALGVELSDNLHSAETIVLVEGVSDEKVLSAILGSLEPSLQQDIKAGRLVFKATRGAGKMRNQIQREKSTACRILAVLDDDVTGRAEAKLIQEMGMLPSENVFLLGGRKTQAELEDLILPDIYVEALSREFGRTFETRHFLSRSHKWSKNFEDAARILGIVQTGEELLDRGKTVIAQAVEEATDAAYRPDGAEHLKALCGLINQTEH